MKNSHLLGDKLLQHLELFGAGNDLVSAVHKLRDALEVEVARVVVVLARESRGALSVFPPARFASSARVLALLLLHATVLDALGVEDLLALDALVALRVERVYALAAVRAAVVLAQLDRLAEGVTGDLEDAASVPLDVDGAGVLPHFVRRFSRGPIHRINFAGTDIDGVTGRLPQVRCFLL